MMKNKLLKKNIRHFCLTNENILHSTLDNLIFINDEKIYESNKNLQNIYFRGSNAYTNTDDGDSLEINIKNKNIQLIENEFLKYVDYSFKIITKDKKTIIQCIDGNLTTLKLFRIFIYLLDKNSKNLIYYEGNNLTNSEINIKVTSLIKDEDYLSFPVSSLGTWLDGSLKKPYQVSEFSGIYNKTLVCTMSSGAVLLLDIEKGTVKQFFKDAKVRSGIFQKEENSPIFMGLKHYTFIEINAETCEMLRQIDIQEELKRVANIPKENPCWLTVGTSIYQNGLFYFYGDTNLLGIFDPITEKIIDYHWFDFDKKKHQQLKGGIENLQVKDEKIYCLDTLGNLYELEK